MDGSWALVSPSLLTRNTCVCVDTIKDGADKCRPDNCDGTYQQYCDSSREYKNITEILQAQGRDELLEYMNKYWKDYEGDDESFWEHEFGKHGAFFRFY